ncbi:MAG TPA: glycosyltransferase family 4 protein [Bacillota bacterium]|nr:glycosyltransferase family 4 protein [Bacillota bacterium]HPZ10878.1 glycosyltransferase family 4 protein [Bacillota bacterium]HQE09044.1 glycosyltransferase family 4 protein [Bacillota bacterium]
MRILMLTWEYPPRVIGGIAHVVSELSRALAGEGNEVEVITTLEENLPHTEKNEGVIIHRVLPYHGRPLNFFAWVHQLNLAMLEKGVSLCLRRRFDLVHAHDWLVAYAARGIKHIFHMPLIASIHATEFGRNQGLHNDEQRYIGEVEWFLTYEAWRVICNSRYMREEIEGVFNLPPDKISIIPNGIRPAAFQVSAPDPAVRQKFAAPGEKIIFFIGRLVREKGVQLLLEALPMIRDRFPNVRAVIAGQGPYAEELHRLSLNLGLDRQVTFAGFIDEETRNQLYAHADVAVFPSHYEPFGLVALEAMATGTPVVVSDTGGFSETVNHGVNGIRAATGNAADLAGQVCALLGNPGLARRLARQALQDVEDKYSWPSIARQYESIYQQIVFSPEARRWRRETGRPEPFLSQPEQVAPVVSPPSRYN